MKRSRSARVLFAPIAVVWIALADGCDLENRVEYAVRVVTYNIHGGKGTDGQLDIERIAQVINSTGADIVALQEVDRNTRRSGFVDQVARLGELTGMNGVFGRARFLDGGEYGNAVLSRFEIEDVSVYDLPYAETPEPRVALAVRITPAGASQSIIFVSTHLQHNSSVDRHAQVNRLNEIFVGELNEDVLLAGDFNFSEPYQSVAAHWVDAAKAGYAAYPTAPADAPDRRLDYVFYRETNPWIVFEARVIAEPTASDHRPVLVRLGRLP